MQLLHTCILHNIIIIIYMHNTSYVPAHMALLLSIEASFLVTGISIGCLTVLGCCN